MTWDHYNDDDIIRIIAQMLGIPIEWQFIIPGLITSVLVFLSGAMYFRRMERVFVDVI